MDKIDNTPVGNMPSSIAPMAKIDGGEIRRLRESMGLTQLYLATFIGVTTDTVSRWENRRYPAIKLENAEKLAEALEVELDAILEHQQAADSSGLETPDAECEGPSPVEKIQQPIDTAGLVPPSAPRRLPFLPWLLLIILLVILGGLSWWMTRPVPPSMFVSAERILPDHIPAGQTFPVLIRVSTNQQAPVALIVKEIIPLGCRVVNSEPPSTSVDSKSGVLKWISRTDKQELVVAYLVQVPIKELTDDALRFSGGVTLNQGDQTQANITGDSIMEIAPFHWADLDRNNVIDDEEILAVYDRYSALVHLNFDRDLIDEIWTGDGYSWDRKTGKYVVQK